MDDAPREIDPTAPTLAALTAPPQDQPPAVLQSGRRRQPVSQAGIRKLMRRARQQRLHAIPPTPGAAVTIGGTEYTVGPRGNLLRRGR